MKVFLSWSGETSRAIAEALRNWLPSVIQAIDPWMSNEDIQKGLNWSSEVATQLSETRFGIICLTPENLEAPWIMFEAGALSKKVDKAFVCPFLFRLNRSDVKGPLAQFQSTEAKKEDIKKLVVTVNDALGEDALSGDKLEKAFDRWWPELEETLDRELTTRGKPQPVREVQDIVEEILEIVRTYARSTEVLTGIGGPYEPSSDKIRVDMIKAALETKGKMRILAALHKGRVSIDGDYFRVDFAPENSGWKAEIEERHTRVAIEDACEQVLGHRLTLRALIGV